MMTGVLSDIPVISAIVSEAKAECGALMMMLSTGILTSGSEAIGTAPRRGGRGGAVPLLSATIAGFNPNAAEVLAATMREEQCGKTPGRAAPVPRPLSGYDYCVTVVTRKTVRISSCRGDAVATLD
jgi:hypothetical protein